MTHIPQRRIYRDSRDGIDAVDSEHGSPILSGTTGIVVAGALREFSRAIRVALSANSVNATIALTDVGRTTIPLLADTDGSATITINTIDAAKFSAGDTVTIDDDNSAAIVRTIDSIDTATGVITLTTPVTAGYTTSQNAVLITGTVTVAVADAAKFSVGDTITIDDDNSAAAERRILEIDTATGVITLTTSVGGFTTSQNAVLITGTVTVAVADITNFSAGNTVIINDDDSPEIERKILEVNAATGVITLTPAVGAGYTTAQNAYVQVVDFEFAQQFSDLLRVGDVLVIGATSVNIVAPIQDNAVAVDADLSAGVNIAFAIYRPYGTSPDSTNPAPGGLFDFSGSRDVTLMARFNGTATTITVDVMVAADADANFIAKLSTHTLEGNSTRKHGEAVRVEHNGMFIGLFVTAITPGADGSVDLIIVQGPPED